ncbi:MAG: hypothetical protein F4X39_09640 [Acidobacteriia bacterium]|nr:hypothetical protein [Terriglobia bacterium]
MHPAGVAARLGPLRHEDGARAEEHREDRHELLVGKHSARRPDVQVHAREIAVGGRVEVRRLRHRECLDIHHEDAEQGDAAQNVDCVDTRVLGDWFGVGTRHGDVASWEDMLIMEHGFGVDLVWTRSPPVAPEVCGRLRSCRGFPFTMRGCNEKSMDGLLTTSRLFSLVCKHYVMVPVNTE